MPGLRRPMQAERQTRMKPLLCAALAACLLAGCGTVTTTRQICPTPKPIQPDCKRSFTHTFTLDAPMAFPNSVEICAFRVENKYPVKVTIWYEPR